MAFVKPFSASVDDRGHFPGNRALTEALPSLGCGGGKYEAEKEK
jgi:hypothetical protein